MLDEPNLPIFVVGLSSICNVITVDWCNQTMSTTDRSERMNILKIVNKLAKLKSKYLKQSRYHLAHSYGTRTIHNSICNSNNSRFLPALANMCRHVFLVDQNDVSSHFQAISKSVYQCSQCKHKRIASNCAFCARVVFASCAIFFSSFFFFFLIHSSPDIVSMYQFIFQLWTGALPHCIPNHNVCIANIANWCSVLCHIHTIISIATIAYISHKI